MGYFGSVPRQPKLDRAEEKIRIVLEGLRGEDSIAERCRGEGINANIYYRWSNALKRLL